MRNGQNGKLSACMCRLLSIVNEFKSLFKNQISKLNVMVYHSCMPVIQEGSGVGLEVHSLPWPNSVSCRMVTVCLVWFHRHVDC